MKNIVAAKSTLLILIIIFFFSCSKKSGPASTEYGNGCITRFVPNVNDYKISGADLDSVNALFAANNLSKNNLEFISFGVDTVVNILPGAYNGYQEQVTAIQFLNGLPLLINGESFIFNAGIYQGNLNTGFTGSLQDNDSSGHQTLPNLRNAFLAHVSESFMEGGAANSKPLVPVASDYINKCLTVVLGYLDASIVPKSNLAYNTSLIKVWRITPASDLSISYYPVVYVEDNNGVAWGEPFFVP